jgi:uncharacterized membrane protein
MENMINKKVSFNETSRVETFSDGVFAIAITLLIIEIKVPTGTELNNGLFQALLNKWPNYLAFFIGFFTVLVCWINHHHAFLHIKKCTQGFCLVNAVVLFVVGFVPYPTAVLAEFIGKNESRTAVQLFGVTYILMALSYRFLWGYAKRYHLTDPDVSDKYKKAVLRMYDIGVVHTIITFIISFWSVPISLVLYVFLFSMFLFPIWYVNLIMKFQNRNKEKQN